MLCVNLNKLAEDLKIAAPHYFLNVPALLDRIRNDVAKQLEKKGRLAFAIFRRGERAWLRREGGQAGVWERVCEFVPRHLLFPRIKAAIGKNLRALICGSAPLSEETQRFFHMLGIPVLQVYGLTETTAICTMDEVRENVVGRVGPAIPGVELRLGDRDEILVRGANVFPGYWNRPAASAEILQNGWLHTGDQGSVDERGNWKITGRLKNLVIPTSGHNISPEPLEQQLLNLLPETEQAVIIGNGRKFLSVIVTGDVPPERVAAALDRLNQGLPHYQQIRKFHLSPQPFTVENGLLTVNRKMKRHAIEAHYLAQIDALYEGARSEASYASPQTMLGVTD
jgi:long-chain acyl-CoA synthetase